MKLINSRFHLISQQYEMILKADPDITIRCSIKVSKDSIYLYGFFIETSPDRVLSEDEARHIPTFIKQSLKIIYPDRELTCDKYDITDTGAVHLGGLWGTAEI